MKQLLESPQAQTTSYSETCYCSVSCLITSTIFEFRLLVNIPATYCHFKKSLILYYDVQQLAQRSDEHIFTKGEGFQPIYLFFAGGFGDLNVAYYTNITIMQLQSVMDFDPQIWGGGARRFLRFKVFYPGVEVIFYDI